MDINEQLEDQAVDLRNILKETEHLPIAQNSEPVSAGSVTKTQIFLAIGIMLAVLAVLYLFINKPAPVSSPPLLSPASRPE